MAYCKPFLLNSNGKAIITIYLIKALLMGINKIQNKKDGEFMADLASKKCIPCSVGAPSLMEDEIEELKNLLRKAGK